MPRKSGMSTEEAKKKAIEMVGAGKKVSEAMASLGYSEKTWANWRYSDKQFAAAVDAARDRLDRATTQGKDPDLLNLSFAEWRKRFLNRDTYPHMQNMIDVIEKREPSWLHPSMTWVPAATNRLIINIPPFHAKSQLVTVDYVTYRVCMNPNVRVLIVSKKQDQAKKFLYQIKQRLTSNLYAELQAAYGPAEGFRSTEGQWSSNQIYVGGRDADEKDPTIEAIGLGGQIYGSRADLIILDDCVVGTNAGEFEKQIQWLESEVENRVFNGSIVIVGTRLATQDMYSELRDGERYLSGTSPWSHLTMPMILEDSQDVDEVVTLWPRSSQPMDQNDPDAVPDEDGMFAAWDPARAVQVRDSKPPRVWALVYQQQQFSEDMTFHPTCVWGSVDKRRVPGPLKPGALGHPDRGQEGMRVVMAIDPASSGEAAIMVMAIDRDTKKRWVLNAWKKRDTIPSWYGDMLEQIAPEYAVTDLIIEQQGYSNWIIHDERITSYCRDHGIRMHSSYTGKNKLDPDLGVMSMAPLFGTMSRVDVGNRYNHDNNNVVMLPDPRRSPGIQSLVSELVQWVPDKKARHLVQDCVMTLWFCEIIARQQLNGREKAPVTHLKNRYRSRGRTAQQRIIPRRQYALEGADVG